MKVGGDARVGVSVRVVRPATDGEVVGSPDAGADRRAQPRNAARAQAVHVPLAEEAVAGVGLAGDGLQQLGPSLGGGAGVSAPA